MIGDDVPGHIKTKGLRLAGQAEAAARRYVTDVVVGMVPTDPEFSAVYEVHDLVTAGHITWASAAEQIRKLRNKGK